MTGRFLATAASADERALALLAEASRQQTRTHPDGYFELLAPGEDPASTGPLQDMCLSETLPKIYERWWRPAFSRLVLKGPLGPSMRGERRIAKRLLDLRPGDHVLDVACGTGGFTRLFAEQVGPEGLVVGIDVSRPMLARAVADTRSAGLGNVAYFHGDAETMPFADGSFDAVGSWASFQLFTHPMRGLDRMVSVLAPGGRLALFTSVVRGRGAVRAVELRIVARSGAHTFERDELVHELGRRGLVDVRQQLAGIMQFIGGRTPERVQS